MDDAGERSRRFFDELWAKGDVWQLESSSFERERLRALAAAVADRRYGRVLEIGAGSGELTRLLAELSGDVLAIDVAPVAIERARRRVDDPHVEFRVADVMKPELVAEGPWDLIVLSETIYYLGWLHSFFDVAWLAHELHGATRPGGRLLLANARAEVEDTLIRPWLIDTYRDLFRNVGFEIERESIYAGVKDGVSADVLITLFRR